MVLRSYFSLPAVVLLLSSALSAHSFTAPTTSTKTSSTIRSKSSHLFTATKSSQQEPNSSYDVLIIGSGICGLSAAAILSKYGYSVALFESHYAPGGAAHGYSIKRPEGTYKFDTGPSFFSGLNSNYPAKSSNPLRTILDVIDESVECIPYETFGLIFPEGEFVHSNTFGESGGVIDQVSGNKGVDQWKKLMQSMQPLADAVDVRIMSISTCILSMADFSHMSTSKYL